MHATKVVTKQASVGKKGSKGVGRVYAEKVSRNKARLYAKKCQ